MLFAVVIPPPQLKAAPAVVDVAVNTSLVVVQLKGTGVMIPASGVLTFCATETEAELTQPLPGSVTETV